MWKHTGIRAFKCDICQKEFGAKSNLNKHLKIHEGNKKYVCETCGKGFISSYNLKTHVRTHSGILAVAVSTNFTHEWFLACMDRHVSF
jgi:uncharacterized Zn-finger protein